MIIIIINNNKEFPPLKCSLFTPKNVFVLQLFPIHQATMCHSCMTLMLYQPTKMRSFIKPECSKETVSPQSLKSTSSSRRKEKKGKVGPLSTTERMKPCMYDGEFLIICLEAEGIVLPNRSIILNVLCRDRNLYFSMVEKAGDGL